MDSAPQKGMKLHLAKLAAFPSVAPVWPPLFCQNILIYYDGTSIVIAELTNNRIIYRMKYSNVQSMVLHGGILAVCISEIYLMDLRDVIDRLHKQENINIGTELPISHIIHLSKTLVASMVVGPGPDSLVDGNGFFGVCKINKRISFYRAGRVVLDCYAKESPCTLLISDEMMGYVDGEELVLYNLWGSEVLRTANNGISTAFMNDGCIYCLMDDGKLIRRRVIGDEHAIDQPFNEVCSFGCDVTYSRYAESILYFTDGKEIVEYDIRSGETRMNNLLGMIHEHSGYSVMDISEGDFKRMRVSNVVELNTSGHSDVGNDDGNTGNDDSDAGNDDVIGDDSDVGNDDSDVGNDDSDVGNDDSDTGNDDVIGNDSDDIKYISSRIIYYTNNIIIRNNHLIEKIIMFNDDVIDSTLHRGALVMSTRSGCLKWGIGETADKESLFTGYILQPLAGAITTMVRHNNIILTGSEDKVLRMWSISDDLQVHKVPFELRFESAITGAAISPDRMVIGTYDGMLHIFTKDPLAECYTCYLTQSVHAKQITSLMMTPELIITTSSDGTAKFWDLNGMLIKKIEDGNFLSGAINESSSLIAIGSSRGIRVFDPSLTQAHFFQTKRPVIACHFYAGYILALTDLIRVYDLNKNRCVKCYDFDLQECWTFSFPFFCARNQTVVLQDASHSVHAAEVEEKRQAKEEEILLDKFAREGRTREELSILLKKEDNGKAFNAIYRGSLADPDLSFLDVFTGRDSRLASVLKSCPGIKYSEIFNRLVSRKTGSNEIASKEIQDVCKKHYESLEKMYMKLLSYLNR